MTKGRQRPVMLVWGGELASQRRLYWRSVLFIWLALIWLMIFLLVPSVLLMALGFAQRGPYGEIIWQFTFNNFTRLAGFGLQGWTSDYLWIVGRSVWVATVTTVVCLLLAYPVTFYIASRRPRARNIWLALVVVPFCTNLVIRTYAWMLILAPSMPLARAAQALGLIDPGRALYPSSFAVYLGMVSSSLPFAILPLYTNVERLDWSIVEAARDLYASKWRVFRHAILPQTLPGLLVAVILTFVPAMGAFVVPDLLGGAKYMLIGNLMQQQFGASRDWPFGAAASLTLILLTLAGLLAMRRFGRGVEVV